MSKPQSFESHAKMVTGYHYMAMMPIMVLVVWSVKGAFSGFSFDAAMGVLTYVALFLIGWYARAFPLGVQNRLIRLEERLRMHELLPEDLRGRISEFTTSQLIGLRFASDREIPALARRVLDGEFADQKSIKQAIEHWRADHERI